MGPVVTIRCTVEMHLELFENGGLASLPQVDDHRWMTTNLGQGSPYLPYPTRYLLTTRMSAVSRAFEEVLTPAVLPRHWNLQVQVARDERQQTRDGYQRAA